MVIRQQDSYLPQLVRLSNARRDIRPLRFSEGGARDIRFSLAADPDMIRAYSTRRMFE